MDAPGAINMGAIAEVKVGETSRKQNLAPPLKPEQGTFPLAKLVVGIYVDWTRIEKSR